jgi:hypothetical protein
MVERPLAERIVVSVGLLCTWPNHTRLVQAVTIHFSWRFETLWERWLRLYMHSDSVPLIFIDAGIHEAVKII